MERAEWLKKIKRNAEALYDHISPQYWVSFGLSQDETHRRYLQKFLARIDNGGTILSAACGAGRYDGLLLEAHCNVVGIDQSAGMLARAKERFPAVDYRKMALQEVSFQAAFDGITCLDAMEHICPEDYSQILCNFQKALKPGGLLYFTADRAEEPDFDLDVYYQRAEAAGLPVVFGEVVDEAAFEWAMEQSELSGEQSDIAVYHYYPPLATVREWIAHADLVIEEEGEGDGFHHFMARRRL